MEDNVKFELNVPFTVLKEWYAKAQFGIHTMWCEHFGIGIVELMASGIIIVAHNTGGPSMDIVRPYNGQPTGFLAATEEEYANTMAKMVSLSSEDIEKVLYCRYFFIHDINIGLDATCCQRTYQTIFR